MFPSNKFAIQMTFKEVTSEKMDNNNTIASQEFVDLSQKIESQQKYINELETTVHLHRLLPSAVKNLKEENDDLKSEVKAKNQQIMDLRNQACDYAQEITSIKVGQTIDPSEMDLRCVINAMKVRDMKNISDLAIFIDETKNMNLDVSNLIEINAMLALDVKNFKKEIDDLKKENLTLYYEENGASVPDSSIAKKTCQTVEEKCVQVDTILTTVQELEQKLLEEKQEKEMLEKTYRHAMNELENLQHRLFNGHIENDTDEDQEDNVQFNALSEFYKSQGSGNLKEDFIKIKKENYNLVENKEGVYRDFALLQENYENIQDKLEKCVEFNDELVESRNLLQAKIEQLEEKNQTWSNNEFHSISIHEFHELQETLKYCQNELEGTKRHHDNNIITIQVLKGRIEEIERKRCDLKSENEQLVTSNYDYKSENEQLQNRVFELEGTKRHRDNNVITIQVLKGRIEEIERKRCDLKSENEQLVTSNHDYKSENKQLQNRFEQIRQNNETLEEKIFNLEHDQRMNNLENHDLETANRVLKGKLDIANWEIDNLNQDIKALGQTCYQYMQEVEMYKLELERTKLNHDYLLHDYLLTIQFLKEKIGEPKSQTLAVEKEQPLIVETQISSNDCRIIMLWKPPMQCHVLLQFPVKVWRYKEELRISPAFKAHDFVKLYIGLYKLRPQAIENKNNRFFSEMVKFMWRMKRQYLPFQCFFLSFY